ncbi:hypothetical protein AUJ95_07130 [Candidatus Desantisbacteria bacterium CG2_30_40_21]|uniref:Uncharacterized protein n=5 Tax=unclassified Candidatus Desantisiibacteriota TaxID=3106372 RepID=A0A2M7J7Y6_9BACT|nr:MAG: hypothetical protein AUJ95_07130 [Candidatus Desantisbacteria bacterium CG2_30_40_21]PIP40847.1 MAG: hypothetical protein COX18_05325 [Candidatus Desantisbacteria bacterium CG23_combo_of_CG06-09_8_20_14_all_40_23]PIX15456.1 MAG: hypothetical protein COZ71_10260 [Candidatus Desantisbacteria bacterium CG_4_8_14_3_um_filter_40_12]PIY19048.1 MAG: hypothetical protein COZ13_07390 [Candidatus Desantisbacteria bacterium CG_4_10_14_3_um_filter_40_18]PJB29807.1 MAG: hypothetical protein CO110_03
MNGIVNSQQGYSESHRDNIDRIVITSVGGALLGGALFTHVGAIIGGLLGAIVGAARNDEIKKMKDNKGGIRTMNEIG